MQLPTNTYVQFSLQAPLEPGIVEQVRHVFYDETTGIFWISVVLLTSDEASGGLMAMADGQPVMLSAVAEGGPEYMFVDHRYVYEQRPESAANIETLVGRCRKLVLGYGSEPSSN